jgi:hypothetical protein
MSRFFLRGISFTALITLFFIIGCGEDDPAASSIPKVTTTAVTNITTSSAESGGSIISDGGEEITARGICWSILANPTIADSKTSDGSGSGSFTSDFTDLTSNTTYFVRAYATNSKGTGYGNSVSFKTGISVDKPAVTTSHAVALNRTTASVGGEVSGDGTISERGVCWGLTTNPTTANNKIISGSGEGNISVNLSGLLAGTQYYARAYAINEAGTSYGESISFKTKNQFNGLYEIVGGSIIRNTATGPDPVLGGDYVDGIEMEMNEIADNAIGILPKYKTGINIAGVDQSRLTIDLSVTLPDGSHPVTISSPVNATLVNTPSSQNKFFPGFPGTAGSATPQEFLLNFEWMGPTPPYTRVVTNLRLRNIDLD